MPIFTNYANKDYIQGLDDDMLDMLMNGPNDTVDQIKEKLYVAEEIARREYVIALKNSKNSECVALSEGKLKCVRSLMRKISTGDNMYE